MPERASFRANRRSTRISAQIVGSRDRENITIMGHEGRDGWTGPCHLRPRSPGSRNRARHCRHPRRLGDPSEQRSCPSPARTRLLVLVPATLLITRPDSHRTSLVVAHTPPSKDRGKNLHRCFRGHRIILRTLRTNRVLDRAHHDERDCHPRRGPQAIMTPPQRSQTFNAPFPSARFENKAAPVSVGPSGQTSRSGASQCR